MKNQFSLGIKTPCSENFNQFTPTNNGGFCGSCEKEVIDFTKMNAEDIITFFKNKSHKNTCGRFKNNQLKTYQNKPNKVKKASFLSSVGLACLALFSFGTTQAQENNNRANQSSKVITTQNEANITVKGTVTEASIPLPGASVILKDTSIGTQTDFDGNFEFPVKLKKGDVLLVSYIGYNAQKVVINEDSALQVELQINMESNMILMGKVAVNKVYKSKKR